MAGTGIDGEPGIVTKISPRSVTGTVSRLTELLEASGLKLVQTKLSRYAPAGLAARHQFSGSHRNRPLTNALIAP